MAETIVIRKWNWEHLIYTILLFTFWFGMILWIGYGLWHSTNFFPKFPDVSILNIINVLGVGGLMIWCVLTFVFPILLYAELELKPLEHIKLCKESRRV